MPLEREGGQAQFIVPQQPPVPRGSTMEPLLSWLDENAGRDLTIGEIAARARMSTRTLNRRFREQTGSTPLQWLHRARIRRAQHLLETTTHPVDRIGGEVGFGSPTAFRDRFKQVAGLSPQQYRRSFRPGGGARGRSYAGPAAAPAMASPVSSTERTRSATDIA
jgi:transcriptional regulator GlxA family with amidase domain